MPARLSIYSRLSSIIKKFRFEELESTVLPIFPEISWDYIRSRLIKNHESFIVTNALRIIEEIVKKGRINENDLIDRVATLEIIEVSRHYKKKIWYTFVMKGQKTEHRTVIGNREMQAKILQNFHVYQLEVDVRLVSKNDITFISIKEKPRGKEPKRMLPIFFALFEKQEYLFCSKKNVTKECLQIVTNSCNYSTIKGVKLTGRDLHSLRKMLMMKNKDYIDSGNFDEIISFENQAIVRSTGIDFRQNKQRREYAQKCFGEEPPTLELLVATGPEQPWKDEKIRSKIPNEKVQISWEFRSHNIAETLTKLAERRVFVMPLPEYVSNLMKTGKNELKLREN